MAGMVLQGHGGASSSKSSSLRATCVQVPLSEASGVFENPGKSGGRDRDRTCDPYHVKVVLFR